MPLSFSRLSKSARFQVFYFYVFYSNVLITQMFLPPEACSHRNIEMFPFDDVSGPFESI